MAVTANCTKCGVAFTEEELGFCKKNHTRKCKKCRREYSQAWYAKNIDKVRATSIKHRPSNDPKARERYRLRVRKVKEIVLRHYSPNLVCQWKGCAWNDLDALSLDHIDNNGAEQLRKLGFLKKNGRTGGGTSFYWWVMKNNYPKGLQVLCMNHQWVKRAFHYRNMRVNFYKLLRGV